jgi:hypothetical protein
MLPLGRMEKIEHPGNRGKLEKIRILPSRTSSPVFQLPETLSGNPTALGEETLSD